MMDLRAAIADVFEGHAELYHDISLTSKDVPYVLAMVSSSIVPGKGMTSIPAAAEHPVSAIR